MYSVILMTAMTASAPETPQFGLRGRACWGGGCVGSCYGYSYGYGCSGSCSGCGGSCHGCYGGYASGGYGRTYGGSYASGLPIRIYGPEIWGAHYLYSQSTPFVPVTPMEEPKRPVTDKGLGGAARLIIEVPADAKVTVDGRPTQSTSEVRLFYTPKLEEGQAYFYDVGVEFPGEKPATRRVYVHANEVVRETFKKPVNGSSLANK